jgi:hypothetical protein
MVSLAQLRYFKITVLWDVITYSSVDLDKQFEGTVCWNVVGSALLKFSYLEMGSTEPGTVVRVTELTEV